jgi:cold shock CspA family protein
VTGKFIGTVKFFRRDRGMGFLARDDGGADVYVGQGEDEKVESGLHAGDRVSFDIMPQRDGRQRAVDVELLGRAPADSHQPPRRPAASQRDRIWTHRGADEP